MENTINHRILLLIKALNMNRNSFGKLTGVSAQTIQNTIGERQSKPSSEILEKILVAVNNLESVRQLNSEWLLTGKGEMFLDTKPKDNGAFGNEVEKFLREQLAEKDRQINSLLKIIEKGRLGKDRVTEYPASVVHYISATDSVTGQSKIAA